MRQYLLSENILYSYITFGRLFIKTFFASKDTQARLTLRRFLIMSAAFPFLLLIQTVHWLGFLIDDIVFRDYRNIEIKKPFFIVGVPRSGTTFLHRLLSNDKKRFTTFTLWELVLAPSITERKIILMFAGIDRVFGSPLNKLVDRLERVIFGSLDDIHTISLNDPEEDYFALASIYACFLMILPFPFPEELGYLAYFDDTAKKNDKERIMAFYKTILQRHLYVKGTDRILLSKNVSFGPLIQALDQTFPDSNIVGMVRHPLNAVPSHISSMMEGAAIFDNDIQGHVLRDQLIDIQRYAYSHLTEVLPRMPEQRHQIIKMEDLQSRLSEVIRGLYQTFGYEMNGDFEDYINKQEARQKTYKSGHRYDLAAYDLKEIDIYKRFSDMYERFNYSPPEDSS